MLEIFFIFTALDITILTGILLWENFQKRSKPITDKIFIILSCSDNSDGLSSILIISIPLFKWDVKVFDYIHHLIYEIYYVLFMDSSHNYST